MPGFPALDLSQKAWGETDYREVVLKEEPRSPSGPLRTPHDGRNNEPQGINLNLKVANGGVPRSTFKSTRHRVSWCMYVPQIPQLWLNVDMGKECAKCDYMHHRYLVFERSNR